LVRRVLEAGLFFVVVLATRVVVFFFAAIVNLAGWLGPA
jgi:hypothetical protein